MAREKKIFCEKYGRGGVKVKLKDDSVPVLRHIDKKFILQDAYLIEAGMVERNGQKLDYQVIKVYLKESQLFASE